MGENVICDNKFVLHFWTGSERGQHPGNVQIDLPDLPLQYGSGTTSRSEVIELKVNYFFGKKLGNSPPLSPPLVVSSIREKRNGPS